jgi:hypothetical protein
MVTAIDNRQPRLTRATKHATVLEISGLLQDGVIPWACSFWGMQRIGLPARVQTENACCFQPGMRRRRNAKQQPHSLHVRNEARDDGVPEVTQNEAGFHQKKSRDPHRASLHASNKAVAVSGGKGIFQHGAFQQKSRNPLFQQQNRQPCQTSLHAHNETTAACAQCKFILARCRRCTNPQHPAGNKANEE